MDKVDKIQDSTSLVDVARETVDKEIHALQGVKQHIGENFCQAVDLIDGMSGKLLATGVGKSGLVARKISATMCSIGIPSLYINPVDAMHGDLGVARAEDVALLLSKSGETDELVTFCRAIRAVGCRTIAIVGRICSTLAKNTDVCLDAAVESEACPLGLAPTSSVIASLALGDALSACLIMRRGVTATSFARHHPSGSLGKRLLLRVKDVMHVGNDLPLVEPGTPVRKVLVQLSGKKMGAAIITTPERKLLGIFTDGDLRRSLETYNDVLSMAIDNIMCKTPVFVRENQMAIEAIDLMENRSCQISVLPVLNDARGVVGIVRIHDLVRAGL